MIALALSRREKSCTVVAAELTDADVFTELDTSKLTGMSYQLRSLHGALVKVNVPAG
jgi:hypothetical protein